MGTPILANAAPVANAHAASPITRITRDAPPTTGGQLNRLG